MKSHGQQVHVEGEWHPCDPSTTQSHDTERDSQSTWPTSFTLNTHISSPREGINLTHVWAGVAEVILCVSQLLPYHLHCLPYGYKHVTKTKYLR